MSQTLWNLNAATLATTRAKHVEDLPHALDRWKAEPHHVDTFHVERLWRFYPDPGPTGGVICPDSIHTVDWEARLTHGGWDWPGTWLCIHHGGDNAHIPGEHDPSTLFVHKNAADAPTVHVVDHQKDAFENLRTSARAGKKQWLGELHGGKWIALTE